MTDIAAYLKEQGREYPSYIDLLEATGLTVETSKDFGSYQGDSIAVVSDGVRRGIVVWGYGSCSGCDALEGATPSYWREDEEQDWSEVNSLADSLLESVRWAPDGDVSLIAKEMLDKNDWYLYDEEMKSYLTELSEGTSSPDREG